MKEITTFGEVEEGKPFRWLRSDQFRVMLDQLPKGRYVITAKKYHPKATHKQFGWLYGHVYPLSMIALRDAGYEIENIDQVDDFWKIMFANKEVFNRETGEVIKLPKSKKEFMTVDQMVYCNQIRDHCAEWLGCYIEEPKVNWKEEQEKLKQADDNA